MNSRESIDLGNSPSQPHAHLPTTSLPQNPHQFAVPQTELPRKMNGFKDGSEPETLNASGFASGSQQRKDEIPKSDSKSKLSLFKFSSHKKESGTSKFERIGGAKLVDHYQKKSKSPIATPTNGRNFAVPGDGKDIEKEFEDMVMPLFMQILSKSRRDSPDHSSNNSVHINSSNSDHHSDEKNATPSREPTNNSHIIEQNKNTFIKRDLNANPNTPNSPQNESEPQYYVNVTNLKEKDSEPYHGVGINAESAFQSGFQSPNNEKVYNTKFDQTLESQNIKDQQELGNNLLPLFNEVYPQKSFEKIHDTIMFRKFLMQIAQCLGSYGCPLYRLEENLDRLSRYSGIDANFAALPGFILVFFTDSEGNHSQTKIVKTNSTYDVQKLELVDALLEDVLNERLSVETGLIKLSFIKSLPMIYPWYYMMFSYCISSMGVCPVAFNGGYKEAGISFLLGMFEYIFYELSKKIPGLQNLVEIISAFMVGFCTSALSKYICFAPVALASLVILLPGMIMTTGFIELLAKSFITGTIKIFYALTIMFVLTFGIQIGQLTFGAITIGGTESPIKLDIDSCVPMSKYWNIIFFPMLVYSCCIFFNMPKKRVPLCLVISVIMYGTFLGVDYLLHIQQISTIASAFVLGASCNVIDRLFGIPPFIFLLTCTLILVPGSVGVRGVSALFSGSSSSELISRMIMSCFSIATGLFLATLVVYPMGKKRSALLSF
ncbi:hypothetical protein BB560_003655 [Smittium megazygosporum]|uniref:Threonine/serine exporter-like N-terminal domain-containing protein n=1 Tax=Smittium megazygosporum TaxID=133381 RepID=A0A2T9ZBE4_9FUNG|nr:hypothetical protein BB560_003655 [Smittium megazygosporum]